MEVPLWLKHTRAISSWRRSQGKRPLNAKGVAESLQLIKDKIETQR